MAPMRGQIFKRLMVGESGKAMQGAVLQQATAIWEVTQKFEESETHAYGLFVSREDAFAEPNAKTL
jgi:hypothetical protein